MRTHGVGTIHSSPGCPLARGAVYQYVLPISWIKW